MNSLLIDLPCIAVLSFINATWVIFLQYAFDKNEPIQVQVNENRYEIDQKQRKTFIEDVIL